jgi:hypothetical protein
MISQDKAVPLNVTMENSVKRQGKTKTKTKNQNKQNQTKKKRQKQ